jgi:hypothetical protein
VRVKLTDVRIPKNEVLLGVALAVEDAAKNERCTDLKSTVKVFAGNLFRDVVPKIILANLDD